MPPVTKAPAPKIGKSGGGGMKPGGGSSQGATQAFSPMDSPFADRQVGAVKSDSANKSASDRPAESSSATQSQGSGGHGKTHYGQQSGVGEGEGEPKSKYGPDAKKPGQKMNALDVAKGLKSGSAQEKLATVKDVVSSVKQIVQDSGGDRKKIISELLSQYANLDKIWGLLLWGIWLFLTLGSAITPPFVLSIGPLLVLNTMLFSPKPAYWLTEVILAFFGIGEAMEEMREFGVFDKITITVWQKIIIVLIDLIGVIIALVATVLIFASFCYFILTPDLVSSFIKYAPSGYVGYAVDKKLGIPIYETCSEFFKFSSDLASGASGTNVTVPGAPINTGQWKDLVNQMAAKYQIDPCAVNTLLLMESSGGDPNAIGHDAHLGITDPFQREEAPRHNLNWSNSHGIGLVQPTIFPNGKWGTPWPDPNIPTRTEWGRNYTVVDLLDPTTNLDFGVRYLSERLKQANGDLRTAFRNYNGSGPYAERYADLAMSRYEKCKSGQ